MQSSGIEVWLDQSELRGGVEWDREIRAQIRSCALFMPLISTAALSRHEGYFRLEWNLAEQRAAMMGRSRPFIVPVCLDTSADAGADVPDTFARVQWTRVSDDASLQALTDRVRQVLTGVERPAPAPLQPGHTDTTQRRPSRRGWYIAALAALAAALIAGTLWIKRDAPPAGAASPAAAPEPPSLVRSIAVLPFLDLSERRDQEYFSDGMSDQLIERLGQTRGLRVIARTSSFFFKGKQATIAQIAAALKVTHVVEGSVRKSGNRIRVTAELIQASDGTHVWSQSYDRDFDDVLRIQDDISTSVVDALTQRLLPLALSASLSRHAVNPAAFDRFLSGLAVARNDISAAGCAKSTALFRQAIELDAAYSKPYAEISKCDTWWLNHETRTEPVAAEARDFADRAIELAPDSVDGYIARAYFRVWGVLDAPGARRDVDQALRIAPNDTDVWRRRGDVLAVFGRLADAIDAEKKAVDLDPLSGLGWNYLAILLFCDQQYHASRAAYAKQDELGIVLDPDWERVNLDLLDGHAAAALDKYARFAADSPWRLRGLAMAEHALGHSRQSGEALRELERRHARDAAFGIAEVLAWTGKQDESLQWLGRAIAQKDTEIASLRSSPFLAALRGDPRFHELIRQLRVE